MGMPMPEYLSASALGYSLHLGVVASAPSTHHLRRTRLQPTEPEINSGSAPPPISGPWITCDAPSALTLPPRSLAVTLRHRHLCLCPQVCTPARADPCNRTLGAPRTQTHTRPCDPPPPSSF
ncbi:hypothetical protein C8R47DRAFT_1219710 [Mycena vitilis]|nr:hypothetical protein C8R47DRAFT_1219710 [Mycena vitilis]